jgi:glycosyltransferase involved in cell wall biosynthesis
MIEGYDIICFSGDWDGDPLSKKHIMRRLARRNRVLWVNSIGNRNPTPSARDLRRVYRKLHDFARDFSHGCRQVMDNVYVYSPLVIPFHGSRVARSLNRRFMTGQLRRVIRQLGFKSPVTWSFIPSSADVAGLFAERLVLYHCVDEFSEFRGADRRAIRNMERRLIAKSDAVIVSSTPLLETKRRHHPNTFLVMHGVEVEHFRRATEPATVVPAEIASLPRPVIGFYGLLADWVDLGVIQRLAQARPQWTFVLIGKCDTDVQALRALPNVRLLGRREYADLPAYCKGFDLALLPFVVNPLTVAASPLKLREYLAAGLPVVAADIPETRRFARLLHIARTDEEYLGAIEEILGAGKMGPQLEISVAMDHESWDEKVEEMSRIVERIERARRPWPAAEPVAEVSAT